MVKYLSVVVAVSAILASQVVLGEEAEMMELILHQGSADAQVRPGPQIGNFERMHEVPMVLTGLIRIYQVLVSSQDTQSCTFTLSCSRFGMEAIRKHGAFYGVLITADRLERCNGFGRGYYPVDPATGLSVDYPTEQYLP
jgi:putative membrane protein insertion efficiency factor